MKKFIILLLLTLSINTYAQRIDKPGEPYEVYCALRMIVDKQCKITLPGKNELYIVDNEEYPITFESIICAMTYMSKRGWEYSSTIENYKFVMKKKVLSDEDIFKDIHVTDKPQKPKKEKAQ